MVFNVLAINNDDHVKNISFLMNKKGTWKLAPAYDLTFAYKSANKWIAEHQMTINGKSKNIKYEDLLTSADNMNIKMNKAKQIISEVKNAVCRWEEFAKEADVYKNDIKAIKDKIHEQLDISKIPQ